MDPIQNVDPRSSLATWLRDGRNRKQLSIEDVAKITKIQLRILERLEAGQYDGLPADVFVKGFVRSFAKCVGLDEGEALDRYGQASALASPSVVVAQAMVETLVPITQRKLDLFAPGPKNLVPEPPVREAPLIEARPVAAIELAKEVVAAPTDTNKKKRLRKKQANQPSRSRRKKQPLAVDAIEATPVERTPVEPVPVEAAPIAAAVIEAALVDAAPVDNAAPVELEPIASQFVHGVTDTESIAIDTAPVAAILALGDAQSTHATIEAKSDPTIDVDVSDGGTVEEPALAEGSQRISQQSIEAEMATWQPTMPPIATAPSVPWRRPNLPRSTAYVVPTLVIDDADPDSADRERDDRAAKEPHRLSFLPPILLDREDRSARQGGLTLAVIILLIAATLTLSYLMRRPSSRGDGVTMLDVPAAADFRG